MSEETKVIFCGLPFKLNTETNELTGFWMFMWPTLGWATDGHGWSFMTYEGNYLKALIYWIRR